MSIQGQFIQIVGNTVCGLELPDGFCVENAEGLFQFAKHHDMAHLLYLIEKNKRKSISSEIKIKIDQQYYQAIRRVSVIENEIDKIKEVLEESNVDYILLKGAVVRRLYPEAWMRVSADIDALVKKTDLLQAEKELENKLDYKVTDRGSHHDHVTFPSGFHIDLHFSLSERESRAKNILDSAWNRCHSKEPASNEYVMEDEMMYFYHIFHMADHFLRGGCGVRPILDTWLLNHNIPFDRDKRTVLLKEGGLFSFSAEMERIAEKWFTQGDVLSFDEVEEFILLGGSYGASQRVAAIQADKGSRKGYILHRLFPPRSAIKHAYPVLQRCPIFLPVCWGHRIVKSLITGKLRIARNELEKSKNTGKQSEKIAEIFKSLELIE